MLLGYCSNIALKYSHCKTIVFYRHKTVMPKGLSTHRRQGEGIYYASRDSKMLKMKPHMP